jgi:hypothetical protein
MKAGQCFSRSLKGHYTYRNLRTIEISLMARYDTEVAHLFHQPSLQEVSFHDAMLPLHNTGGPNVANTEQCPRHH